MIENNNEKYSKNTRIFGLIFFIVSTIIAGFIITFPISLAGYFIHSITGNEKLKDWSVIGMKGSCAGFLISFVMHVLMYL